MVDPPARDAPPVRFRKSLGSPALFAIIWTSLASAIYFSLGIVTERAVGLTPLVFLGSGVFFVLTAMTYVEGAAMHPERAGSTVFARYAFNELWSFVAAWAVLLDFLILIAVCAFAATNYVAAFWAPLGRGGPEVALALAIVGYVALRNIRGFGGAGLRERAAALVLLDLVLQLVVIVIGAFVVVDLPGLTDTIDLGTTPSWPDLLFALTVSTVAFTSLESAAGMAGEVQVSPRGLKRLIASATASVIVIYVGISLVAVAALPVTPGAGPLHGDALDAPVIAIVETFDPHWLSQILVYATAALATLTLVVGAHAAMLGLSRLSYSLATNRQIPSAVGRLHPRHGTPYVVIFIATVLAAALVVPRDLDFLVGIYAFGAMLAFLIAHVSICVLRYRERDLERPYSVPLSIRVRGGDLPLPSVLGALMAAGWAWRACSRFTPARESSGSSGWAWASRSTSRIAAARARRSSGAWWCPRRRCGPSRCASSTGRSSSRSSARRWMTTSCRWPAASPPPRTPTIPAARARRSRRSGCSRCRCRCRWMLACPTRSCAARAARWRGRRRSARSTRASSSRPRRSARGGRERESWRRRHAAASS